MRKLIRLSLIQPSLVWLAGPVLWASLAFGPALAAEQAPPGGPAQAQAQAGGADQDGDDIDSDALDILKRMADTLAQAKGFTVTIRSNYDAVQDTGEKIEFGERRMVTLSRPSALKVEAQDSAGKKTIVTYDGKAIVVYTPADNVYGMVEKAGSVDNAVHYLVRDLQVRLPLALLLVTTLPDELDQRLVALDYVERDTLTPVPTDHLAGQTDEVDFQVWIPAEGTPLPQRITITYKNDDGEPQFRADLTDWVLNPDVSAAQLAFRPPDGAERIPFLARVRRTASGQPPSPDDESRNAPAASGKAEGPAQ